MSIIKRTLTCKLTVEEVAGFSSELARITAEGAEIERQKKSTMSHFKDKLDSNESERHTLARKVSTQEEMREVDCEWVYHQSTKDLIRFDTGEVVETKRLTAEEMQAKLDI